MMKKYLKPRIKTANMESGNFMDTYLSAPQIGVTGGGSSSNAGGSAPDAKPAWL